MPTDDIVSRLPEWLLIGMVILFAVSFIGKQLAEASESFAKALGPLGKWWRRWVDLNEESKTAAFKYAVTEAMNTELGVTRRAEYQELSKQLVGVLERVEQMERTETITEAYLVKDGDWHRQVNITLAEVGHLIAPLPEREPYSIFEAKYRNMQGWGAKPVYDDPPAGQVTGVQ